MKKKNNKSMTKSPFQKVDANQPVPISEVVAKATGAISINNEEPNIPKAYIAGKDYFDQLKNNIKDCDPDIDIDLYKINIDPITGKEDNERAFRISLFTKCDNEMICTFNVENEKDTWADIINILSKDIVNIIKKYQSGDLDSKSEGELLQKSMKENFEKITSNLKNNKPEEKNKVSYPVEADNTKKDSESDKAKSTKTIDSAADNNKVVDFNLTEFEKELIYDSIRGGKDYTQSLLEGLTEIEDDDFDEKYIILHDIIYDMIPYYLNGGNKAINLDSKYIEVITYVVDAYKNITFDTNILKVEDKIIHNILPKLI